MRRGNGRGRIRPSTLALHSARHHPREGCLVVPLMGDAERAGPPLQSAARAMAR